jgi:hypothetical protein
MHGLGQGAPPRNTAGGERRTNGTGRAAGSQGLHFGVLLSEGIMTETDPDFMPGHPEALKPEPDDLEPDENPEPGEQEG